VPLTGRQGVVGVLSLVSASDASGRRFTRVVFTRSAPASMRRMSSGMTATGYVSSQSSVMTTSPLPSRTARSMAGP